MFWRLGFTNAWRNLERSLPAIICMALATGFMAYALSFSRGSASGLFAHYRSLMGGEIIAYSLNFDIAQQDDAVLKYKDQINVQNTNLDVLMPELAKNGTMSATQSGTPFAVATLAEMKEIPGISGVYPRYQLPAQSCGVSGVWNTPLIGRDLQLDAQQKQPLSKFITQGRWLDESDQGAMVAVINSLQHYPAGQRQLGTGDTLQLLVPRIIEQEGQLHYDYSNPLAVELHVIGVLELPPRPLDYSFTITVPIPGGGPDSQMAKTSAFSTSLPTINDEVQIPLETWQAIWRAAGGGEYVPQQLGLMMNDLSYIEDTVLQLRNAFPEHSFYSATQLIGRAQAQLQLEDFSKALQDPGILENIQIGSENQQFVLSEDLRLPLTVLFLLNSALVVAANLLIIASERKREIGILKAVGATRVEVMQMVLSEALLISLVGATGGFLFLRIPAALNHMTNKVPLTTILGYLAADLAIAIGVAGVFTLIFAMIPAVKSANQSMLDVMREADT